MRIIDGVATVNGYYYHAGSTEASPRGSKYIMLYTQEIQPPARQASLSIEQKEPHHTCS